MPSIAFVTYARLPELSEDDQLLADAVRSLGGEVHAVSWDDERVHWDGFDLVVVRSTWDYHLRPDEFARWMDARAAGRAPVANPPAVLRWNASKRYLIEVAARGVPVVPTRLIERGAPTTLARIGEETGWSSVVVKPVVSASAWSTWRTALPADEAIEARFASEVAERAVMVQPFVEAIGRDGELSLLFAGGRFSHAVRKRAREGDFRVQHEHGGSAEVTTVNESIIAAARRALAVAPAPTLYARVDGCMIDGAFVLMELELLEPSLFLRTMREAAVTFAKEIVRATGR